MLRTLFRPTTTAPVLRGVCATVTPSSLFASTTPTNTTTSTTSTTKPSSFFTLTTPHRWLSSTTTEPPSPSSIVEGKLTSCVLTLADNPGALQAVLGTFLDHRVNLSHIQSRPSKKVPKHFDIVVDFEGRPGSPRVDNLLRELQDTCLVVSQQDPITVPWFPATITDINQFSQQTLDAGSELESDHPGFNDEAYRQRRKDIVAIAMEYNIGEPIPRIEYTKDELKTWGIVYEKLKTYTDKYAVQSYKDIMPELEKHCGYGVDSIPQLEDISQYLKSITGFQLKPVGGLLSARDFLNGLAYRVFFSTQYIRHSSVPLYTPEPDICHELIGHAPMFADPDFAEFSHDIGLASLGASDEDIRRLATCYWFSVEFGLAREGGEMKAYGAGLLSSFGELEYSCSPTRPAGDVAHFPTYLDWEPEKAAVTDYPITEYQPTYFVADSMSHAKAEMRRFIETLNRPFHVEYNPYSKSVAVDRCVERGEYTVTLQKDM